MTNDAFQILRFMIGQIWRFFNSFYLPGTNVTVAGFFFLFLFLAVVIKFIKRLTYTDHSDEDD